MNKVGIYYAYWTHEWDVEFLPFVSKVKKLGFDILEVNAGTIATMSKSDRETLRKAASDEGIELTFCIGLPKAYDIASSDSSIRSAGVKYLQQMASAVGEMKGKTIGGIIYGSWPGKMPEGQTDHRPFIERSVASMKEAVKTAEQNGVTLCVEVVNRFEHYIMNTASEAVDYVKQVGSPNCQILLDSFHLNIEEDSIAGAIRTAGANLKHFHIGETNRRAPGRGRMPWDELFGALKSIGYTGAITMEPFLMPGGSVGRDISIFRDLKGDLDLDAEAKRACEFVKRFF